MRVIYNCLTVFLLIASGFVVVNAQEVVSTSTSTTTKQKTIVTENGDILCVLTNGDNVLCELVNEAEKSISNKSAVIGEDGKPRCAFKNRLYVPCDSLNENGDITLKSTNSIYLYSNFLLILGSYVYYIALAILLVACIYIFKKIKNRK